ncbi:MAG: PqqD family protein [Prevotella sp.]|nr:PqqD family protein [Prevotella sp.]
MRLKKGFVLREVCGERVIMGEGLGAVDFGRLLCLNETAAWLWQQAQEAGDFTVGMLAERLSETYDVSIEEARKDVADIVAEWDEVHILAME